MDTRVIDDSTRRAEGQDFLKWGVRADVNSLQQGVYKGKSATLIAFEFRFLSSDDSSRFSEARIVVTFDATNEQKSLGGQRPIVERYCPKLLEGPVTKGTYNSETEIYALVAGPNFVLVTPEVGILRTNGIVYVKDYMMKIKGMRWSKNGMEPDDQVK